MIRNALAAALVTAVAASMLGAPVAATGAARVPVAGCARPLLAEAGPAAQVKVETPRKFAAAAALNGETIRSLTVLSKDDGYWLDRCGQMLHLDPTEAMGEPSDGGPAHDHTDASAAALDTAATTPAATLAGSAPADVLTLASKPGAAKTVYLDFTGDTLVNTAWNNLVGAATLPMEPFSLAAPADTNFSAAERTAIYNAWIGLAEDFAPFDVNVTTIDPGFAALQRDSATDQVYGARALFTQPETVQGWCGCSGIAYVNTVGMSGDGSDAYRPALVFSPGGFDLDYASTYLNNVASHELGHNFGLSHDGRDSYEYYGGDETWGPIMGSPNTRLTQWSRGEYTGATNTEDDLAIIAATAPVRADDHADTAAGATALDPYAIRRGIIATRADVDAFTFTGSGETTVAAAAGSAFTSNLDIQMTIRAADGRTVAVVDPPPGSSWLPEPGGLDATWTGTLPATPDTYTVLIDGVGIGDPAIDGNYTDYASLGQYKVMVDTAVPDGAPAPLTVTADATMTPEVGQPYAHAPVTASGGTGPYTWAATNLPYDWAIDPSTGVISGTADYQFDQDVDVTVTDATGVWRTRTVPLSAQYPPYPFDVPDQTLTGFEVGSLRSLPLASTGAVETPTWYRQSTLPPGLYLTGAGMVTGVPTAAGTFSFDVMAVSGPYYDTGTVTVLVSPAAVTPPPPTEPPTTVDPVTALAFGKTALGSGKVGGRYKATLTVTGGKGAVTWKQKGALPPGVKMRPSTDGRALTLVGKPTRSDRFRFRLVAVDKTGHRVTEDFVLRIKRR